MADDVIRDVPPRYPESFGMGVSDRFNLRKVSWGAIWAGAMVTIGMEALFLTFGIFIGAMMGGSTVWTMAWYLVTMAVSFFAGAVSAARLSDTDVRGVCALHGVTVWGVATLATAILGMAASLVWLGRFGGPFTAAAWGPIEQWGGVIWGGVFLSLLTSYFGGATAHPSPEIARASGRTMSTGPMQRPI